MTKEEDQIKRDVAVVDNYTQDDDLLSFFWEKQGYHYYPVKSWFSKSQINRSQQIIYCDNICVKTQIENRFLKKLNDFTKNDFTCKIA